MTSIFQQAIFRKFLYDTDVLTPFRFSVSRNNKEVGIVQGFIQQDGGRLKRYLSRRAIINGGPWLADDISFEELELLLKKCTDGLKKKVIYIETRNFSDYSKWRGVFENGGFMYEPHYDYVIDTTGLETVDQQVHKSRKRDVATSFKKGTTIIDDPDEEDIIAFYSILEKLYRKKVKTPLFPLSLFLQLHQQPFSQFILVKYDGSVVGGTVLVYDQETAYEWFACGKDGDYKNVYPSTVATYYGIRWTAEHGCKHFDMMGAGAPGDGGYGVREFKAKFGGQLVDYGRFKYISNPFLFSIGRFGVKLLKRI